MPEEGILLSRPGLPEFVDYSYGFSIPESFGRWSDTTHGLKAGFKMNRSFTGNVCLLFQAGATPSMLKETAMARFGDEYSKLAFRQQGLETYAVDFNLKRPADDFELQIPKMMPKASPKDGRRLAIGVTWIRILPGPCSALVDASH
jgi:hypothetical protein